MRDNHRPRRVAAVVRSSGAALRAALVLGALIASPVLGQAGAREASPGALPTIEERTRDMRRIDGFLPMYWEESAGRLWLEIDQLDTELLHIAGLAAGLGSNDIGLDRGQLQGSRIVQFERRGPKVLMVQPNYRYRASSSNPAEVRAVRDAFARSVLWGFTVAAETGDRVLVDLSDFLLRDATNIAQRLRPGTYRLEPSRSSVYLPMVQNFPQNTEMEVELTFVQQPGAGGGAGGGGDFEGVGSVAATSEAASLRLHHSFVALPEDGYTPRLADPRAGFFGTTYEDYATPLGESMSVRLISRHRLEKRDPAAAMSEPVEPIVYYLDPGAPEPVRTALLGGARWWNQAFEAAGYRDAFRVEILPDSVSPLDIRYNVINWVHRSTRGWSYGSSVTDPRTGEIIKGVVTLGSLRVRQDYMLAEGLLSPYTTGDETPEGLSEWALARIRQLSAHEVGHTLGISHNYYSSEAGRISVMDYPHPLVTLAGDRIDYSEVYKDGIAEWDSVAIRWGYADFPPGTNESEALERILSEAAERDILFLSNQDVAISPRVDQWSNGANASAELNRMMEVRRFALDRFGEGAIRRNRPLATLEEVLVPLYLHHRYQVEAAASVLGGLHFQYRLRGDGGVPYRRASADEQRGALNALVATISPSALALPASILERIPPRPSGFGRSRELFPRWTGEAFDAITPAVVAADHVVSNVLAPERAARLVEQNGLEPGLPGLHDVLDRLMSATFEARPANAYEAEIARAVQRVLIERLIDLAGGSNVMPQVRALATYALKQRGDALTTSQATDSPAAAHAMALAGDIQRFLERPSAPYTLPGIPTAPPGAPIGQPPMHWLDRVEPPCSVWEHEHPWNW
jgi:hypothetical protein